MPTRQDPLPPLRAVLVERVRARLAQKRGGGAGAATLDSGAVDPRPAFGADDVLSLDAALVELQRHPDEHEVTLRRFFAGRSNAEIARDLGVAEAA